MLSDYQKSLIIDMGKKNYYLIENDKGYFLGSIEGKIVKKINKRSFYCLLKNQFLVKLKTLNNSICVYGLSNKSLILFSSNNRLDINKLLNNNDFKVLEVQSLDRKFNNEFNKIYNLKNITKYYICNYKFDVSNKDYLLIIAEDKDGSYHIGSKDYYNKILEPYCKIPNYNELKSYLRIVFDIIMESEMDCEI